MANLVRRKCYFYLSADSQEQDLKLERDSSKEKGFHGKELNHVSSEIHFKKIKIML